MQSSAQQLKQALFLIKCKVMDLFRGNDFLVAQPLDSRDELLKGSYEACLSFNRKGSQRYHFEFFKRGAW